MVYDMETTIVEATSLSTITHIASNPPTLPGAPSDLPRLPLTLYIARVPGSRDVFLTPIKPREKVVTAEDVSSSLYYIHVNSLEDYEESAPRPSSVNTDAGNLVPIREESVRRKPIPPPKRSIVSSMPPYPLNDGPPMSLPPSPPKHGGIMRKPVGLRPNGNDPQRLGLPVVSSRPLPSPPTDQSFPENNVHLLRRAERSDENNLYHREHTPSTPPLDSADPPQQGSLTLIRRDPASSEQWNVALIYDPPVDEISSAALRNPTAAQRTKQGGAPLYLDISNPSYMQFTDQNRPNSRISTDTTSSGSSDSTPEGVFRRRLFMPGSRFGAHNYGQNLKSGSVGSVDIQSLEVASGQRSIRHSVDVSAYSMNTSYSNPRSKGYTFASPWNGPCEFSTGATGKSLKCRHHVPATYGGTIAVAVSELRFNLPTSSSKVARTPLSEKRSSYMSGLHRRLHSSDDNGSIDFVFDDDGKLDLTLGREKAGGGFGGRQAKLGKLIIHPDGLGMLDLLVAANIGLWWRAWGR